MAGWFGFVADSGRCSLERFFAGGGGRDADWRWVLEWRSWGNFRVLEAGQDCWKIGGFRFGWRGRAGGCRSCCLEGSGRFALWDWGGGGGIRFFALAGHKLLMYLSLLRLSILNSHRTFYTFHVCISPHSSYGHPR